MKSETQDQTLILKPETHLVASNVENLRNDFLQAIKASPDATRVVLDVTGVDTVDSLGVNLVIGLFRQADSESKSFEITGAGEDFMKVANFFKFPTLFNISTQEDAK